MTPITNDTNMVLRATSDARKLELISAHLNINLAEIILEETAKEQAEQLAELKRQEEELQKELVRKLKAQREFIKQGFLSGSIIAITPKRKLWSDVDQLTDSQCYTIKNAVHEILNTNSFPVYAREIHIDCDGVDLLILCRKSA
ncbi:hypothetical protein [Methanocorpusculum sp. GPch4]|uniref:hypothetical protein n=1 Tax=Methanocorpusculum sp. GPch4 TaxID=2527877 RepID=UPI0014334685|nr:hypothetical protein [Methanocorpusculum sp. GPch4]